jgi:class 3 adenylate cyclase
MAKLPSGTVTLLFTDVDRSTELVKRLLDRYGTVLATHRDVLRAAFAEHGGIEVDTQGDAFFVAFGHARSAVEAAVTAQRALAECPWPDEVPLSVRMGLHTGEPYPAEHGYTGVPVHRAARVCTWRTEAKCCFRVLRLGSSTTRRFRAWRCETSATTG